MSELPGMEPPADRELVATIGRVIYHNVENQYAVLMVDEEYGGAETVVGHVFNPVEGQKLKLRVRKAYHKRYGEQLEVVSYQELLPTSREGVIHYLSSRFVKGLGPALAEQIVDRFGDETIAVLDDAPERLLEVPGIGPKRLEQVRESWQASRQVRALMMFLSEHGVGPGMAVRIHQRYGDEAISRIKADPYQLALDVDRIGFRTADQLAMRLGIAPDAPARLQAGVLYALHQQTLAGGHCFLPRAELRGGAARALQVEDEARIDAVIGDLLASDQLIAEHGLGRGLEPIYLPLFHRAERELTRRLGFLAERAPAPLADEAPVGELTETQTQAMRTALSSRLSVITGGPGVGKTTLIRELVSAAQRRGRTLALAAPTGRAARRLSEATGHPASTIHRMLRFNPQRERFEVDAEQPLDADLVIVDEASMVDIFLMRDLLRALNALASLVLVGDADQLPSVGPGAVLHDLIESQVFPVTRLTEVFRQSEGSQIVAAAHAVNRGQLPPRPESEELGDYYFVRQGDPARAAALIERLVSERIPERFGFDPLRDVQVITPMHKGEVGTVELGARLQAALNPDGQTFTSGDHRYRVGDKVMQVRNNHDEEVYNGDVGYVVAADESEGTLRVAFDERTLTYEGRELDDLQQAYCVTVHKSQGSEYPAVVLPLMTQHFPMLQRNLVYTALTRGKRLVVVVGSERALELAVTNDRVRRRYTLLARRLERLFAPGEPDDIFGP